MSRPRGQRGGLLSLLLSLLAIGAVLYFVLRGGSGAGPANGATGGTAGDAAMIGCERVIADLVGRTGGTGDAYAAGYAKLPPSCRKLTPAPGALEPSAARLPDG